MDDKRQKKLYLGVSFYITVFLFVSILLIICAFRIGSVLGFFGYRRCADACYNRLCYCVSANARPEFF